MTIVRWLAAVFSALGALVFGITPTSAQAAQHAPSPRAEPSPKVKPAAKVRIQSKLFRSDREREKWCDTAEAWAASLGRGDGARSDRASRKRLRWLELRIAATRNPGVFEKGRP